MGYSPVSVSPIHDASQLKEIVRDRWNIRERVEGWIGSDLNAEFEDPACREAWKRALCRAVTGTRPGDALDIGTGPGTIAELWAELGYAATGLDISPAMLDAARLRAAEKRQATRYLEGDAESPPFLRKRFDVISSRFVLYTLPRPGYALRRWVSLLRPGGALVLIGHDRQEGPKPPQRPPAPAARWQDERHREAMSRLPFMNHTSTDLLVVMEAAGLCEIERVPTEELVAARNTLRVRRTPVGLQQDTPFILVGRKGCMRTERSTRR